MGMREDMKSGQKRGALGKGFSSLLGLNDDEMAGSIAQATDSGVAVAPGKAIVDMPIDAIEPNPHQPRKLFDDEALLSLSASIKEDGVMQPVVVAKTERPGKFILIAGERRWRASKLAGKEEIPAIIRDSANDDMLRLALIENIQRQDLSIIEEAEAYQSLIKDFGLTQDQCAQKVGKDRSTVTNALRLLHLPREIQDDMMDNRLTMGHGRALLSLEDKRLMLRARDIVIKKELNVRQTEQLCKTFGQSQQAGASGSSESPAANADLDYLSETLRSHLRTKVKIAGTGSRGKIEISYFTAAELERILGTLGLDLK